MDKRSGEPPSRTEISKTSPANDLFKRKAKDINRAAKVATDSSFGANDHAETPKVLMHEDSEVNMHNEHISKFKSMLDDMKNAGVSEKRTKPLEKGIKKIDKLFNECRQKSTLENQYELYGKYTRELTEFLSKNAEIQHNDVLHQLEDNTTQQNAEQDRAEHKTLNETNIVSEKELLKKQSRFTQKYITDLWKKSYNKFKETRNSKRKQKVLESEVSISKGKQKMPEAAMSADPNGTGVDALGRQKSGLTISEGDTRTSLSGVTPSPKAKMKLWRSISSLLSKSDRSTSTGKSNNETNLTLKQVIGMLRRSKTASKNELGKQKILEAGSTSQSKQKSREVLPLENTKATQMLVNDRSKSTEESNNREALKLNKLKENFEKDIVNSKIDDLLKCFSDVSVEITMRRDPSAQIDKASTSVYKKLDTMYRTSVKHWPDDVLTMVQSVSEAALTKREINWNSKASFKSIISQRLEDLEDSQLQKCMKIFNDASNASSIGASSDIEVENSYNIVYEKSLDEILASPQKLSKEVFGAIHEVLKDM